MSDATPVDPERGQDILDRLATFQFSRPAAPPAEARGITGNTTYNAQVTRLVMSGCMNRPAWEIDPSRGALGPPTRPRKRADFFVADTAVFQAAQPSELAGALDDQPFDRAVAARMLWLDRVWFARLGVLTAACPVTARWWRSKRIAMERCPGRYGLFETPTDRYPCNVRGLCPWCWARDAVKDAQRIEATFFPRLTGRSVGDLTFRQLALDCDEDSVKGLAAERARQRGTISRAKDVDVLRKLGWTRDDRRARCGLYERMRIIPRRWKHGEWTILVRQVIFTPPGVRPPDPAPMLDAEITSYGPFRTPGRYQVRRIVAWANRYPSYLLRGDPSRVFHALAAREGIQSSITAGVFRGARKKGGRQ